MVRQDHSLPVEHLQHGELRHVGEASVLQHEVRQEDHVGAGLAGRARPRFLRDVAAQHEVLHHVLGAAAEDREPRLGNLHPVHARRHLGRAQVVHRVAQPLAQRLLHLVIAQLLAHARFEHLALEMLVDVVDAARLEAAHLVRAVGAPGEEQHRRVGDVVRLQAPAELEAVHAGHVDVDEDQVGTLGAREVDGVRGDVRAHHAIVRAELRFEILGDDGIVVDREDGRLVAHGMTVSFDATRIFTVSRCWRSFAARAVSSAGSPSAAARSSARLSIDAQRKP